MSLRVDILPEGTIEIMVHHGERLKFLKYGSLESAMIVILFLIRRDLELSEKNKFVSQATIEARKAFQLLQEKSPYGKKT
jgi:hypothetical protein